MNRLRTLVAATAMVVSVTSLPAHASSTVGSSAADGSSASVGSVSDSFGSSSNSSNKTVAAGDYKVTELVAVLDRPGMLRMKLQPVAGNNLEAPAFLYVPRQALKQTPVKVGQVVAARTRPYGTEFTNSNTGKSFLLVLQDSWYRELQSTRVTL